MTAAIALPGDATLNLTGVGGSGGPNTLRPPYASSLAPSMADSLPGLSKFGFDDLRACMSSFTSRFDKFVEQGRMRVLEERNQFRMNLAEINDTEASTNRELHALRSKTSQYSAQLSAQSLETSDMHSAITSLSSTRDTHAAHADSMRHKLVSARNAVNSRKATIKENQQYLAYQATFNQSELRFWEERLGLRISGSGREDVVRFSFVFNSDNKRRDYSSGDREASFELDTSKSNGSDRAYQVTNTRPNLRSAGLQDKVDACTKNMCEHEDLAAFLKRMRDIFLQVM